jgi:fatty acid desaturase
MARNGATARTLTREPSEIRRLDRMNLGVLAAQTTAWAVCLWLAAHIDNGWLLALLSAFFCLMMQGVFSMMHEAFHGHAHSNSRVNGAICWLASALFGASATLIRINHLGHHVRNRTRAELVDFVAHDESRLIKTLAYYFAILGGIWLASFVGSLLLAVAPARAAQRLKTRGDANTYAAAFADFEPADFARVRVEVVAAIVLWLTAFWLLDLRWQSVLLLYAAFALSWSSLQWIYHVRTPLHVVEGTYNLRSPWFIRALFLNFNYNLTHHRDPGMRWQLMHAATDLKLTRPFWHAWLAILKPPRPLPDEGELAKTYF